MYRAYTIMVWTAAVASLDSFLQFLDGQVKRLQYSINIVMYGDLALPFVGEIQQYTQLLVGFAPVDFHLPQAILKDTLILGSEPSDCIVNNCRGFVRNLAVIDVEADHLMLYLDHFIGHAPIIWIDLVPLLCETLHELLVVQYCCHHGSVDSIQILH
jgi:hypothetical protein